MNHTLVEIDRFIVDLSLSELDVHVSKIKLQLDREVKQSAHSLHKAGPILTSFALSAFTTNIIRSASYTLTSIEAPEEWKDCGPSRGWNKVQHCSPSEPPAYCWTNDSSCFCSCLIPSKMGYPCQHLLCVNRPRPFVKGYLVSQQSAQSYQFQHLFHLIEQFLKRWLLEGTLPTNLYESRSAEPEKMVDPKRPRGRNTQRRIPNREERVLRESKN